MYHYEISDDIPALVDNATIAHLDELWHRFSEACGGLPDYAELSPERLDWCRDDLMVVTPVASDDFRYEYYGRSIAATSGFDMTGKRSSDFHSDVGRYFRDMYARCLRDGLPVYTVHRATHAAAVHTWERLLMPVVREGGEAVVAFNRPMSFRHEFLQGVLDATSNGIMCLAAVRDSSGALSDFHILSVNGAAAEMLGRDLDAVTDRRLGEGFLEHFSDRITQLCRDVFESGERGKAEVHGMHNGVHRYLQMSAARSGDSVTLALTDVAELHARDLELDEANRRVAEEAGERKRLEAQMYSMRDTDGLTGALGREAFLHRLGGEVARAQRHGRALGLLVLDLDRLSAVNEAHGEMAGDRILTELADTCSRALREGDFLGRVEAEEFAVGLPEAGETGAREAAERLRDAVARTFAERSMLSMRVTASVGVAVLKPGDDHLALLERASAGLRQARHEGRDRVVMAD
jgi:diguanylate cyclase (GGDEF)-like protein